MIKKHDKDIKRILIPTNLKQIRLNTELPIFVDWKSAPLKTMQSLSGMNVLS